MKKTKEIRRILLGRTKVENGEIRLANSGENSLLIGGNGILNVLFLGIRQKKRCYSVPEGADPLADGKKALGHVGKSVRLQETPGVPACLKRNTMANQRLFTADLTENGELELSVFMGRTFLDSFTMELSLRKLGSFLPQGYLPERKRFSLKDCIDRYREIKQRARGRFGEDESRKTQPEETQNASNTEMKEDSADEPQKT